LADSCQDMFQCYPLARLKFTEPVWSYLVRDSICDIDASFLAPVHSSVRMRMKCLLVVCCVVDVLQQCYEALRGVATNSSCREPWPCCRTLRLSTPCRYFLNESCQSINQSINQSKHICIAPYVVNESEAHNGRD